MILKKAPMPVRGWILVRYMRTEKRAGQRVALSFICRYANSCSDLLQEL